MSSATSFLTLLSSLRLAPYEPPTNWPGPSHSPMGRYTTAAVAAHNGLCSEIGRNLMTEGGSVVDAAIATSICMGAMEPQASGLGGGAFINIFDSSLGDCTLIDAREVAPIASTKKMYVNDSTASTIGMKAIGVPGELAGLWKAYQIGGVLPWKDLLMPTVKLCMKGFPVSEALAKEIKQNEDEIGPEEYNMGIFFRSDNSSKNKAESSGVQERGPWKRGEIMKRPVLGEFIKKLAEAGDPTKVYYHGKLAEKMVEEIQKGGGIITMKDFESYQPIVRDDKIESTLPNGFKMCGHPPPSSAAVTQSIVNIMASFPILNPKQNLSSLQRTADLFHRYLEVMKFAYADRSKLGDMNFVSSALKLANNITSSDHTQRIHDLITLSAHKEKYYGGEFVARKDGGTTHISVMDKKGNAVSITTTVNTHFGCQRRSPSTGVIWNNQMDDFSTPGQINAFGYSPSPNNFILPGKRPMSSMSPSIVYEPFSKKAILAVGTSGGSRIISSTASVTYWILMMGKSVKEAIDQPRVHNQRLPFQSYYEHDFPLRLREDLEKRGQRFEELPHAAGITQAIHRSRDGILYANCDHRKGSGAYPAGF